MNEIRNFKDLIEERNRLESKLLLQKELVKNDFAELRQDLNPALNVLSTVAKFTQVSRSNPLISAGVSMAADLLFGQTLLSKSGKVTKVVVPFLAGKLSTLFLNKDNNIFKKITAKLLGRRSNGIHPTAG